MRSDSICTGSPLCYYRIITKIIIFFLAWLYPYQRSEAQIIITEIMFDADTLENHNEYVEIYNAGAEPVSLLGWQLGDATETDAVIDAGWGMVLSTQQYAVILDPSYFNNSTIYDNLIPDSALILTIEDASFGSYGWSNSVPEPVILLNSVGDTIQIYFYSLDNLPGFSDEKIRLLPDNTPQNWANSAVFRGTPGYQNSVTPLNIDLQLDSIWIEPTFPISNQTFFLFASLINVGLQAIPDIDLVIFFDHNGNSFPDSTEIVHRESDLISLLPEENYEVNWEMPGLEAGHYLLGILAETAGDNNEDNNRKIISIEIEGLEKPIIINEIMYNPGSGAAEWIELYNKGIQNIDLDRWLIADSRDTIVIGRTTKILGSFDFMVLGEDSSILNAYGISGTHFIYVPSFPTLNNDADDLKLFSSSKSLQDRVTYSASWMRRQTSAGTSLERIHPEISSLLADNWAASADPSGATPGRKNSVFIQKPTVTSILNVQPNPFSPDGDGYEDYVIFEYRLPFPTGFITLFVYDIKGRKIKSLADYAAVGQNGHFIWDGRDDSGRMSRMGMYIILARIFEPIQDQFQEIKKTVVLVKRR